MAELVDSGADIALPSFPMPRGCPMRPPEEYARMREEAPATKVALRHGRTAWLLTRQQDIRDMLLHPQASADRKHPGFPLQVRMPQDIPDARLTSLIGLDPPEHTALRRLIIPEFTVKRVHAMRPRIQEIVDARIADLLAGDGTGDLVHDFALPTASMVICELLGVPYADHAFFTSRAETILARDATEQQQDAAYHDVLGYFDEAVARKEKDPGPDLLGRLVVRLREAGAYERDIVVGMGRLMVVAGHEATPSMIALGAIALLERPGLLAEVRDEPALAPRLVDELLRYFSISDQSTFRVALGDLEIGGVTIPAGEGVIGLNLSGNWDAEQFRNPEEIDPHANKGRHLAFGFGHHQCVAQNLARVNIEVALMTLFERMPGLRMTRPVDELPFKSDQLVYGIHSLPVTW